MFSKNKWILANRNLLVAVSLSILTIASCGGGGGGGGSGSSSPNEKPVSVSLTATPSIVGPGETTTLSWVSTNAKSCELTNQAGIKVASGLSDAYTTTLPLDSAAAFTITCTGVTAGDTVSQTKTFAKVSAPPTITLSASPPSVASGAKTTISWSSSNSTSCKFTDGSLYGAPDTYIVLLTSGSFNTAALTGPATFRMQCDGPGGSITTPPFSVGIDTCSTTGATGNILLPSVAASRTNGVAPLSVFFDATSATAPAKTTRPFHELEYRWEFEVNPSTDIPVAGTTWGAGSRSGVSRKNSATGPVAAHVYETPGTYKVTLTVTDGTNTVTNKCTQITVHDPDVIFAGASLTGPNTICVGSTSAPTPGTNSCPADALGVQQANFTTAITNYAKTGKRVLFKRGDIFSSTSRAILSVTGPGIIGVYGSGSIPVIQGSHNTSIIALSNQDTPNSTYNLKDWRIMDLNFIGSGGNNTKAVEMNGGINKVTLLRVTSQQNSYGVLASNNLLDYYNTSSTLAWHGHTIWDEISIVDSTISNPPQAAGSYGIYISAEHLFLAGNSIDLNVTDPLAQVQHDVRLPYVAKAAITNNTLQNPGKNKVNLKLHSPIWGATGVQIGIGGGYSRWIALSDNKYIAGINLWITTIGPQDSVSDQRVRDVVVEREWYASGSATEAHLEINAQDITIRNSIFDAASTAANGIEIANRGIEPPPLNINVYNNSYYSSFSGSSRGIYPIKIGTTPVNVTAINNIGYAPNSTSPSTTMIYGTGASGFITQFNTANLLINPLFTITPPVIPTDYQLQAGSYGINSSGAVVPVFSDFAGNNRVSTNDMGSYQY